MSSLESAILWSPLEGVAQVSRNSQKLLVKELTNLQAASKSLSAMLPATAAGGNEAGEMSTKNKMQMMKALQAMHKDALSLKKKLEEAEKNANKFSIQCTSRLHYLKEVDRLASNNRSGSIANNEGTEPVKNGNKEQEAVSQGDVEMDIAPSSSGARKSNSSASFNVTPQLRKDRIFAEYLLRTNRPTTANLLIQSNQSLASLVDSEVFANGRKIEHSLMEMKDCAKALAWCGENRSRLNKLQSTFEFDLRLQEFLGLVQQKKTTLAIEYARKHLVPATVTTPAPASTPASTATTSTQLVRTNSLPTASTDDASNPSLIRNNSVGPTNPATSPIELKSDDAVISDPMRLKVLQEAMNLLVFYGFDDSLSNTTNLPQAWHKYRAYWSPNRFQQLVKRFRETQLAIYGLNKKSTLEYVLNVGLSSFKTSSCRCSHIGPHGQPYNEALNATIQQTQSEPKNEDVRMSDDEVAVSSNLIGTEAASSLSQPPTSFSFTPLPKPSSCPSCTAPLSCLATSLPVAPRTQSRLVCRISGMLMDDKNPPMALPNGYVYSKYALTNIANQNNGIVTCPRTKQQFPFAEARIAYVL